MVLEKVNDIISKENPDKILLYFRDILIFKGNSKDFNRDTILGELNVYTYEYINKENKIMLIRVLESEI